MTKLVVKQLDNHMWELEHEGTNCGYAETPEFVIGRYLLNAQDRAGLPDIQLIAKQMPQPEALRPPSIKHGHDLGMLPKMQILYEFDVFCIWVTTLPRGERALVYTVDSPNGFDVTRLLIFVYGDQRNDAPGLALDRANFDNDVKRLMAGSLLAPFMRQATAIYQATYGSSGLSRVLQVNWEDIPEQDRPGSDATVVRVASPSILHPNHNYQDFDFFLHLKFMDRTWSAIYGRFKTGSVIERRKFETFGRWMDKHQRWVENQPESIQHERPVVTFLPGQMWEQTLNIPKIERGYRSDLKHKPTSDILRIPEIWHVDDPEELYRALGYNSRSQTFAGGRLRSGSKEANRTTSQTVAELMYQFVKN